MQIAKNSSYTSFLKEFDSTIRRLSIYPPDHPAVKAALQKTFKLFQEFFKTKGEITLGRVENKLVLEEESLEANAVSDKVWNTLEKQKIKSISFVQGLKEEELRSFLEFFLKKEQEDLSSYFQKSRISHIKLNRMRYEVVLEDEKVVKTEQIENVSLKSELSKIIRAYPDLLKDLILGKSIEKEKLQMAFKAAGISSYPGVEGAASGAGGGVGEGGVDIKKIREDLKNEVYSLSDEEILSLLTYSIKQGLKDVPQQKNPSQEALEMVKKVLEKRDKQRLLPRLKELLSGYGIIDEKYFDLLIDGTFQRKEEAISRTVEFFEELGKGRIEEEGLEERIKTIVGSPDEKLKNKIFDSLLDKLDSADEKLWHDSVLALKQMIEISISGEKEEDFVYIRERLEEQFDNQSVSIRFYRGYFELLSSIYTHLSKTGNLNELKRIMERIHSKTQAEQRIPEIRRLKNDFINQVSSGESLDLLIQPFFTDFHTQKGKEIEEFLKNLDPNKVARKLIEIFTVEERSVRVWSLRVLSELGEESVEALSNFLYYRENFKRSKDTNVLEEESWYKVRNALFVLGNIESARAIDILTDFAKDPDPRVRLEILKGLEKKKDEKINQVFLELLKDQDEEVRKKALNLLSLTKDKNLITELKRAFFTDSFDRKRILTSMVNLDESGSRDFILKVAADEKFIPANISKREKEELQISALSLLAKIGDDECFQKLREFVRKRRKGILGRWGRDEVTEKAQRVLSIKDKEIDNSEL
jgi:hypothetical protein